MKYFDLKFGDNLVKVGVNENTLLGVIESKCMKSLDEDAVIKDSLNNPIGSNRLRAIVKKNEKVCIVVSDITRLWQKMWKYLPFIVEELNSAGIKDENIVFICATGSHRSQSQDEHNMILGEKLKDRFTLIDHNCMNEKNLKFLGNTSFGTPVYINKIAFECDHIILTGAIVFHDMAGFGGGRKSILPGISGYKTIMANHSLSLNPETGMGINPLTESGQIQNNPIHKDMIEACELVKPSFMFNVIIDEKGNITKAVSGHYVKAYEEGCRIVKEMDGVSIHEKADLVIASAGGYPKDINLYQSSKAITNAQHALKPGGTMIILAECREGFGNNEVQYIIENFNSNLEREEELRKNYTISKFSGFLVTDAAEKYNIVLVSKLGKSSLEALGIDVVDSIEEAIELVTRKNGANLSTYIMPCGATTLPMIDK